MRALLQILNRRGILCCKNILLMIKFRLYTIFNDMYILMRIHNDGEDICQIGCELRHSRHNSVKV